MASLAHYPLGDLTPTEALQLLAEAASQKAGGRHLSSVQVVIDEAPSQLPVVTLIVPSREQLGRGQEVEQQWDGLAALRKAYDNLKGFGVAEKSETPPGAFAIREGVARLLLCRELSANAAQAAEKDWLLVAQGISMDRAREIFDQIIRDATDSEATWAVYKPKGNRQEVYFFHVHDDPDRKSAFRGCVAGDFFHDCPPLKGVRNGDDLVFLPCEFIPSQERLAAFCLLVREAPALFGVGLTSPVLRTGRPRPVAAIVRNHSKVALEDEEYTVFYLAHLVFSDQLNLAPGIGVARVVVADLSSTPTELARLPTLFSTMDRRVGYQVELRPTPYRSADEGRCQKLREQRDALTLQLAGLEHLGVDQPRLYRFSHKQLPEMIELLCAYPLQTISDGHIKYAFQAARSQDFAVEGSASDQGAGLHYLYFDPAFSGSLLGRESSSFWDSLDPLTKRFWLDPYWLKYYGEYSGRSLLFVPYGTAMFPTLHSWEPTDIEPYLQDIVREWYRRSGGQTGQKTTAELTIPDEPIYIFDNAPASGARVDVVILDRQQFQPFKQRLPWLNGLVDVLEREDIEPLIRELADSNARIRLAERLQRESEESLKRFQEARSGIEEKICKDVRALTRELDREIERVIRDTHATTQRIIELYERLRNLADKESEIRTTAGVMKEQRDQALSWTEAVEKYHSELFGRISRATAKARREREEMMDLISAEVDSLEEAISYLESQLSLKKGGRM